MDSKKSVDYVLGYRAAELHYVNLIMLLTWLFFLSGFLNMLLFGWLRSLGAL